MTDAELLNGARLGDAEAWRALYQRYLPAVWRQAYALVSDPHVAEDITSETMLALLRGLDGLCPETTTISGWLRSVVRHKAADHQRVMIRTREKLALAANTEIDRGSAASPSARLETAETRNLVLKVLDAMPDRERIMLEWKYLDSLGVREIAERLGETEKAVETVLYRARQEFRRLFELRTGNVCTSRDHDMQGDTNREP